MSFYRIYEYPCADVPFKHVYIKRGRGGGRGDVETAAENTVSILKSLEEYERRENNLARMKRTVVDITLCNRFEYFCTFTFRENRYDYDVCRKRLAVFFNHYKTRYAPNFQYLIIPETHQDGAFHFHGLCAGFAENDLTVPDFIFKRVDGELVQVPNTPGYMDWPRYSGKLGLFNCSPIRNYAKCAFYITKYITKEILTLGKGRQGFMCSKGLTRPELVYDADDMPMLFNPDFENEHCAMAYVKRQETEEYFLPERIERDFWEGDFDEALEPFGDLVAFDPDYVQMVF